MNKQESLEAAISSSTPELKNYISALKSENALLHKKIAALQVQDLSKENRISALESELKELAKKNGFSLTINMGDNKKHNKSSKPTPHTGAA